MGFVSTIISRDVNTGGPVLDHVVASNTYSEAPSNVTDGFVLRKSSAASYDAVELTYSFVGGSTELQALVLPWYYTGTQGTWVSARTPEILAYSSTSSSNPTRISDVPAAASKLYLQVLSISGQTAPTHLYMTVYGLTGAALNVDTGDIYTQGANFASIGTMLTFGKPSNPALPFDGNVDATTAQGAALPCSPPALNKSWQTVQSDCSTGL